MSEKRPTYRFVSVYRSLVVVLPYNCRDMYARFKEFRFSTRSRRVARALLDARQCPMGRKEPMAWMLDSGKGAAETYRQMRELTAAVQKKREAT